MAKGVPLEESAAEVPASAASAENAAVVTESDDAEAGGADDETVAAFLKEHADDIAAEADKPFKPMGGIVELLGEDYFPITQSAEEPILCN